MGQLQRNGTFAAQGNDGRYYLVTSWIDIVDPRAESGPRGIPLKSYRLDDERLVKALPDGRYEVVGSPIVLDPIVRMPIARRIARMLGITRASWKPTAEMPSDKAKIPR